MQTSIASKNEELMNIRSRWTERERAERKLIARLKQRRLTDILEWATSSQPKKQPKLLMAKSC